MIKTTSEKRLKSLIKESVREVLKAEISKLRALSVPEISDKEQKDIEKLYGVPSRKMVKSINI